MKKTLIIVCLLVFALANAPRAIAEQVDVELVLAVDVSGSMNSTELRLQRRGYAQAFQSRDVHQAIEKGLIGAIAVMYVEWARDDLKKVIVPWTKIASAADANQFADRLLAAEYANMRNTSISGALRYGAEQMVRNNFEGLRRVIDISGDGPNNQGGLVTTARDAVVADGIIVNGLPLITDVARQSLGYGGVRLDAYFRACVIGGPGSFVIGVEDWNEFPQAVRRKLVLELAADKHTIPVIKTQFLEPAPNVDCQIGEKMRRTWDDP